MAETHPSFKYRGNPLRSFCVILIANQQTNHTEVHKHNQTDVSEQRGFIITHDCIALLVVYQIEGFKSEFSSGGKSEKRGRDFEYFGLWNDEADHAYKSCHHLYYHQATNDIFKVKRVVKKEIRLWVSQNL